MLAGQEQETLTLKLASHEMAVKFGLTDEKLKFPSLSGRLPFLFLDFCAVNCLLLFAFAHIPFLAFVLFPKYQHFTHQPLSFRLHIFGPFTCSGEWLAGLSGCELRQSFRLSLPSLVTHGMVLIHLGKRMSLEYRQTLGHFSHFGDISPGQVSPNFALGFFQCFYTLEHCRVVNLLGFLQRRDDIIEFVYEGSRMSRGRWPGECGSDIARRRSKNMCQA